MGKIKERSCVHARGHILSPIPEAMEISLNVCLRDILDDFKDVGISNEK